MARRSLEGPPKVWSSAKEAAAWLGIPVKQFRQEVKAYPQLLPVKKLGRTFRWFWEDLCAYVRVRNRTAEISSELFSEEES